MISQKLHQEIIIMCYAEISSLFAMMNNPKYRGDKFTWEDFPDMAKGLCTAKVHFLVEYSGKRKQQKQQKQQIEKMAEKYALEIANTLYKIIVE